MTRLIKALCFALFLALCARTAIAETVAPAPPTPNEGSGTGDTHYASPSGSGSSCSLSSPCSKSEAVSQATAGETVIFLDGDYTNDPLITTRSGSSGNHIFFKAQNQHAARFITNNNSTPIEVKHDFITIDGLYTSNGPEAFEGKHCLKIGNGGQNDVVIRNVLMKTCGNNGTRIRGNTASDRIFYYNNIVDGTALNPDAAPGDGNNGECYYAGNSDGPTVSNVVYQGNICKDYISNCFDLKDSTEKVWVFDNICEGEVPESAHGVPDVTRDGIIMVRGDRNYIYNNIIRNNQIESTIFVFGKNGQKSLVYNNIVHGNNDISDLGRTKGDDGGTSPDVYNNTFWDNSSEAFTQSDFSYTAINNIGVNRSNNLSSPSSSIFVDAANDDFHLVAGASAAIDQASGEPFSGTDFDGNAIVGGTRDYGAFEFGSAVPVTTFYVNGAVGVNDSNCGQSSGDPCATFAFANSEHSFTAGDTVCIQNTTGTQELNEKIELTSAISGTSGNPFIIDGKCDGQANRGIIDGTALAVSAPLALIALNGVSWVELHDLEIRDYAGAAVKGIRGYNGTNNIKIYRPHVHNIGDGGNSESIGVSFGDGFLDTDGGHTHLIEGSVPSDRFDPTTYDCRIHDNYWNSVKIADNNTGGQSSTIRNCAIYDAQGNASNSDSFQGAARAHNWTIQDSFFSNGPNGEDALDLGWGSTSTDCLAQGGGQTGHIIERNVFADYAPQGGNGAPGRAMFVLNGCTENITIRNNVINTAARGIEGYAHPKNIKVYHNTIRTSLFNLRWWQMVDGFDVINNIFIGCVGGTCDSGGPVSVDANTRQCCQDNNHCLWQNNVIVAVDGQTDAMTWDILGGSFTAGGCLASAASRTETLYSESQIDTFEAFGWLGAVSRTNDSSWGILPQFISIPSNNFQLQSFDTVARNKGQVIGSVTTDFAGNLRDANPDLGAFEAGAAQGTDDITSDLIAHLEFEDNLNDSAGSTIWTHTGTPSYETGRVGTKAITFDGLSGLVANVHQIGSTRLFPVAGNPFTVSAWFKSTDQGAIVASAVPLQADRDFQLDVSATKINTYMRGTVTASTPSPVDGNWHHVVVTWDGTAGQFYRDNVLLPGGLGIGTSAEDTGENITVGSRTGGTGFQFTGAIDDVRIYARALHPDAVNALFNLTPTSIAQPKAGGGILAGGEHQ